MRATSRSKGVYSRAMTRTMIDGFGRRISYVRLSVTDRCDLRCRYCMAEQMTFPAGDELLSFDEIEALADLLIARGVTRIRLTGGEPLVRRGILELVAAARRRIGNGLDELTLTTNGTQLAGAAEQPVRQAAFGASTSASTASIPSASRTSPAAGGSTRCLPGSRRRRRRGSRSRSTWSRSNGLNEDEIEPMLRWCAGEGFDLTLIETMPLGEVEEDRTAHYLPLDGVKQRLEERFTLVPSLARTGGPARYFDVVGAWRPARPHHADQQQFLQRLQPHPGDRDGHGLWLPRPRPEGRSCGTCSGSGNVERAGEALDRLIAGKPERHGFEIARLSARGRAAHVGYWRVSGVDLGQPKIQIGGARPGGYDVMVACQLPKLNARVRFPLPAPKSRPCRHGPTLERPNEVSWERQLQPVRGTGVRAGARDLRERRPAYPTSS